MADFRGYEADVLIDEIPYHCGRFRIVDAVSEKDVTPAEMEGFYDWCDDIRVAEIVLEHMTYASDVNPFSTPIDLYPRRVHMVQIWPEGFGVGSPWDFPSVKVLSVEHAGDSSSLQPITVIAKTRGPFTEPWEGNPSPTFNDPPGSLGYFGA